MRLSWFSRAGGRGTYVAPFARVERVTAEGRSTSAIGWSAGVFAGRAFRLGAKVDLRVGLGAQYLHYVVDAMTEVTTPFVAIDLVVGYRL